MRGHIKLVDFGFAKIMDKPYTTSFCGTPSYMAPEIILRQPYTQSVDIWSLGNIIHEMITGSPPFQAKTALATYERILMDSYIPLQPHHQHHQYLQSEQQQQQVTPELQDLVIRMLHRLPERRLSIHEIQLHSWFYDIHWDLVEALGLKPPYVPGNEFQITLKKSNNNISSISPVIKKSPSYDTFSSSLEITEFDIEKTFIGF